MKKISFLLAFAFLLPVATFAQQPDSVSLLSARWQKHKIAPKTRLLTYHFEGHRLFNAAQNISYIEIRQKGNAPFFALGNEVKEKKSTSTFGRENQALAAINGTFFDVAQGGSVDFVKVDGRIEKENRLEKKGLRARHQRAALVIDDAGRLKLKKWDKDPRWEYLLPEKQVMLSGPLLLFGGHNESLDSTAFSTDRHPRSAIGLKPDGRVILLTADGRQPQAAGLSLVELRALMRWLGCTEAINLDGGGSTTLWVGPGAKGAGKLPPNGVINFPSDNKTWDHEGERKVANVVLLKN